MTLERRRRRTLYENESGDVKIWLNMNIFWPTSIGAKFGRFNFNNKQGWTTARLPGGFTWRDRD